MPPKANASKKKPSVRTNQPGKRSSLTATSGPAARSVIYRQPETTVSTNKSGIVRVCNSEIILNLITGNADGTLRAFSGVLMPSVFPWLGGVASNYSKYRWRSLRLHYVPVCPTSTVGRFAMAVFYDPLDAFPGTIAGLSSSARSIVGPVWGDSGGKVTTAMDISRLTQPYYNYITIGQWVALPLAARGPYTPGQIFVGVDLTANDTAVGTLRAEYEIELFDPVPSSSNQ